MSSDKNEAGYHIERLTTANLGDVEKLYAVVYGKPAPVGFFIKKYDTLYTGKQFIGYIAYNTDEVAVGYYGVIPCFIQDGNAIILSAQSADTMTHPQFRYKGLFVELSNKAFDLCKAEGIRIIFGFPNQNSFHGAIHKLGWKMTETMDCFIIPINALPLKKITTKISFLKPLYKKYKQWVLKKYRSGQHVANSMITDGYSGVYRDANYFSYKTYHNHEVIQVGRALIWIKLDTSFIIGDMTVAFDNFDNVMKEVKKLAARLGVGQVQFQTSPHTNLHALFAKSYKAAPSFPVLFQDFDSGLVLDKFKFTLADIDIF